MKGYLHQDYQSITRLRALANRVRPLPIGNGGNGKFTEGTYMYKTEQKFKNQI